MNQSIHPRIIARDSYTFLMKELERVDPEIQEPLSGTDWPRDMPVITGGGLLESIVSIDVTYASTGGEEDNLVVEAANDIPVIQADLSKSVAAYKPGDPVDILVRGTIVVETNGTVSPGGNVHCRTTDGTLVTTPIAEGGSFQLTNCHFRGPADSSNHTELVITERNLV